jgi:hypothetical protein
VLIAVARARIGARPGRALDLYGRDPLLDSRQKQDALREGQCIDEPRSPALIRVLQYVLLKLAPAERIIAATTARLREARSHRMPTSRRF